MLPHHYLSVELKPGARSIAYFARAPKGVLLLFVHGFVGHRTDTWELMHEMLPNEPSLIGVDIVFYGYKSTQGQALSNANLLRQFISSFVTREKNDEPSERQKLKFAYKKIVIVAHSLGAALTRQAQLDALKMKERWARRTSLVLFGPAHCGAFLAKVGFELGASTRLLSALTAAIGFAIPVVRDLRPDSDFIKDLQSQTLAYLKKNPKAPLKAKRVIFGDSDRVVMVRNFCADPVSDTWLDCNHTSVCKVSQRFRRPIDEIISFI